MIFFFLGGDTLFQLYYEKLLNIWINSLIKYEKRILGEINYIYCNDESLIMINNKYLNHNFYTDVITFNYVRDIIIYGDIYISIDRIKENALKWGVSFEKELYRIMVHGILHLLSYKDKFHTEKLIMHNKENFYLNLLIFNIEKCFMM